jgi:hypothetical protein
MNSPLILVAFDCVAIKYEDDECDEERREDAQRNQPRHWDLLGADFYVLCVTIA